ncbi:hypothetical protein [Streptomyces griseus]|uniref:hypothetical protein n=1 Tax=Streptomyces griseus TaxID=1911 RepID=UPI0037A4E38A
MTDTSPTPADQLRACLTAAVVETMQPRYGGPQHNTPGGLSLTATAEEIQLHRARPIVEAVLTSLPAPALAVARQLLGTTTAEGATVDLEPQDHPGADLFVALQHAGLDVDEANRRMYAYARMVLRQEKATAAPPIPLAEVWTVWRENETTVYGHFATVDDARQGTIDCWQKNEPVCPDYSWRQDGPRLELVVGGEFGGVYASRHQVYGAPPAAPAAPEATQ